MPLVQAMACVRWVSIRPMKFSDKKTSESKLRAACVNLARKTLPSEWEIFRHEDSLRAGIPDMSINGARRTVWWEFKHAHPSVRDRGVQHFTCCRLQKQSHCFYVIYYETAKYENRKTYIVLPTDLGSFEESTLWCSGFNHKWVVSYMQRAQQE